jgi:3-methyladenine DNA glycosylase AlkD
MTLAEAMGELEGLGSEKMRATNLRNGGADPQFGVKKADLRGIAKRIKTDHDLAWELWETGNLDAKLLAILIVKPKKLDRSEAERLTREAGCSLAADWVNPYVVKPHPAKEEMRRAWMDDPHPFAQRAAWSLTAERIEKSPEGIDLEAILQRIEREMPHADPLIQWTMNGALAAIGIHHPELREQALELGERLGIYRDYPASPGCISPFAPIWIREMSARKGG